MNIQNDFYKFAEKLEKSYFSVLHKFNTKKFNFTQIIESNIPENNDIFLNLFEGKINGIIIKGFMTNEEVDAFFKNLNEHQQNLTLWKKVVFGKILGGGLQTAKPDLVDYFKDAKTLRKELKVLFGFDFDERVIKVIEKISNHIPVSIAQTTNGEIFAGSNIRFVECDTDAAIEHVGLRFFDIMPSLDKLSQVIDNSGQISYFMPLQYPEKGGELRLYDLMYEDEPERFRKLNNDNPKLLRYVKNKKTELVKPGVGDLLIFNGGHIWHRVCRGYGKRPRITVGGFLNYTPNRDKITIWS